MRIVAWDTESTDLSAIMGRLLCSSFAVIESDGTTRVHTLRGDEKRFKGRSRVDDSKLAEAIRDELEKHNLAVTWNGKMHDKPLLNARLARVGKRLWQPQWHLDLMWYAKGNSLKIGSAKLDNVAKYLKLGEQKTPITWEEWQEAAAGDKKALDVVVEHCEADVRVLAEAYWRMLPLVANLHR